MSWLGSLRICTKYYFWMFARHWRNQFSSPPPKMTKMHSSTRRGNSSSFRLLNQSYFLKGSLLETTKPENALSAAKLALYRPQSWRKVAFCVTARVHFGTRFIRKKFRAAFHAAPTTLSPRNIFFALPRIPYLDVFRMEECRTFSYYSLSGVYTRK